jgi:hypothetical protein
MKQIAGALLLSLLFSTPALAQTGAESAPKSRSQAKEQWSADGLQKVQVKGMDVVYMRPEASLAGYDKVWLGPISINFRRGWERSTAAGTHQRVRPADAQRIRDRLSAVLREELVEELTRGGYQLVESAGDEVLSVNASIIDLYIASPDVPTTANVRVYSVSAGEMTLIAELRDSVTGEIILRAYDRAAASETIRPHQISNVENASEARRAAKSWAMALRAQLDAANKTPRSATDP